MLDGLGKGDGEEEAARRRKSFRNLQPLHAGGIRSASASTGVPDQRSGRPALQFTYSPSGHTDRVWGLAWNLATDADGVPAILASCSGDKTVRIWQQRSRSSISFDCKAVLEDIHTRKIRSCVWSPSGKQLATAGFDATTAIWEQNGSDFECVSTLEGHENEVKSV
ncbi:hypothetical protein L2E82_09999 [Cichorium intybus]|uniref:Uncharacterized protein n=1 Tax=Cichorium intybus TaxID=13427 RepID=A0ACB9GBK1_CICIN|nr:hypothetical protein L2E82_09999 [Cichorium intybus]